MTDQNSARLVGAVAVALLALGGCSNDVPAGSDTGSNPEVLRAEVVATRPHDRSAFTQGLEISGDELLEGTGERGSSFISARNLTTGEQRARVPLGADLFGEGITVVDDRIWQLTWRNGVAIERDLTSLAETGRVSYDGEGWGLCAQSDRLVMSDGSSTLTFRDRKTFAVLGHVDVTEDGARKQNLNELECVGTTVYANVWRQDEIVRIDSDTGAVTGVIDASGLLEPSERAAVDVLNGIAAVPRSDTFLLTGKWWPTVFEVRFVPR